MPKKQRDEQFEEYAELYGEDALEELLELLEEFPELEEYLDDLFSYDDEDFYTTSGE